MRKTVNLYFTQHDIRVQQVTYFVTCYKLSKMAVVCDKKGVYGKDKCHELSNFWKQDIPILTDAKM